MNRGAPMAALAGVAPRRLSKNRTRINADLADIAASIGSLPIRDNPLNLRPSVFYSCLSLPLRQIVGPRQQGTEFWKFLPQKSFILREMS